jgi:hypothetical protein
LTIQEGSKAIVPSTGEIGGMQAVAVEGILPALPLSHDLVLSLGRKDPALSGTIVNNSDYTLKDAVLITPGNWERLGDLRRAHRSWSVSLAAARVLSFAGPMTILNRGMTIFKGCGSARRYALLQNVLAPDYQRNDGTGAFT